jgi:hypothetical protein
MVGGAGGSYVRDLVRADAIDVWFARFARVFQISKTQLAYRDGFCYCSANGGGHRGQ